jgi:Concanavalin A-like lectin/glucanases superfamily
MTRNRRRAVLVAVVGTALALPAQAVADYEDRVLADDPLTYLRLGEATGDTVARDASPNKRHGTYAGAPVLGLEGPFAEAGTSARLAAGDKITATVTTASRSVELWVNPNRLANGQQAGLVAHGNPAGDGWALGIGAKRRLVWSGGGSTVSSKVTLPAGTWTLVTVAWTDQKVHIYRNGALARSLSRDGATPVSGSGALVIGGTGAGAFAGRLDEVALFGEPLTADDIREHLLSSGVPVNVTVPSITGRPVVGKTLVAKPGSWNDGGSPTYRWQRCDADGEDCDDVAGATGTSYVVTAGDACGTLQVAETVSNGSGAATAISAPTDAVAGTCAGGPGGGGDPVTGGDPETGSDPTPTPTPILAPAPATAPVVGAPGAGPGEAAAGCLTLLAGRRTLNVRGLGTLRLKAGTGRCVTAPLAASFKARKDVKLDAVRYTLDGKRLKGTTRAARLPPAALRAGTHKLSVRVTPRGGKARRATLRLRLALG